MFSTYYLKIGMFLFSIWLALKVEGDKRTNFTFSEAIAKCSRSGGHLATISSMHEQGKTPILYR